MNWELYLTENLKWMITAIILFIGLIVSIISLRKKTPRTIVKVIQKSKEPESPIGILLLGGFLGFVIGRNWKEEDI